MIVRTEIVCEMIFFPFAACRRDNNSLLFRARIETDKKKNKVHGRFVAVLVRMYTHRPT